MTTLVLSSGGSWGAAQLGALIALEKINTQFDLIVGTSIGALVATGWAFTKDTEMMYEKAIFMNKLIPKFNPGISQRITF